jgi:hypothetical protein
MFKQKWFKRLGIVTLALLAVLLLFATTKAPEEVDPGTYLYVNGQYRSDHAYGIPSPDMPIMLEWRSPKAARCLLAGRERTQDVSSFGNQPVGDLPSESATYTVTCYGEEDNEIGVAAASIHIDAKLAAPGCKFPGPWAVSTTPVAKTVNGENLHPRHLLGDPFITFDDGKYKMWFTTVNSKRVLGTAYAESPDGHTWTVWKDPDAPDSVVDLVLSPTPGGWDTVGVETVSVIKMPDGTYRLYHTGDMPPEGSHTFAIGLATSRDGIHWEKKGKVFEAENPWEQPICGLPQSPDRCIMGGVLEPTVLYDADEGLFKMWYAGLGKIGEEISYRIGYATSRDGIAWKRRTNPVLVGTKGNWDELLVSHVHVARDPQGGYHLFYFGTSRAEYREGVEQQRGKLGHAYSFDGIVWQKDPKNPILAPRPGLFDAWTIGGPNAVFKDGQIELWYFGASTKERSLEAHIGRATAACRLP